MIWAIGSEEVTAGLDYKQKQMNCQILKMPHAQWNALYLIHCIVLSGNINVSSTEDTLRYHKRAAWGQTEELP